MTSRLALSPLLLVSGCTLVDYPTIEEACPEHVRGERFLDDGIHDLMLRIDCHRRYVNLGGLPITRTAQDAVSAHATYLDQNQILQPGSPTAGQTFESVFVEDPSMSFYSGGTVYDRLAVAQAIDPTTPYNVWEVLLPVSDVTSSDRQLDFWGLRDVVFQPYVLASGYAEITTTAGDWAYMNIVYAVPANRRIANPVVFPKDGQVDVPTSYVPSGLPEDPLSVRSVIGYPITITVGSDEATGGVNPYGLRVISATLTGPDGEDVDIAAALPKLYPWGPDETTVAFAAKMPMKSGSTYTLDAEIAWNANPHKKVQTTFTTAFNAPQPSDAATERQAVFRTRSFDPRPVLHVP